MDFKLVFVLLICFISSQGFELQDYDLSLRIVNGEDAKLGEIPYQVSLQTKTHFCGGTIINKDWIVTAAHCLQRKAVSSIKIVAGTIDLKKPNKIHQASRILKHEKYLDGLFQEYDIALIRVATPFNFTNAIKPVTLPKAFVNVTTNSSAIVSGYGHLVGPAGGISDKLKKAKVLIADQEYCRKTMFKWSRKVTPLNVCASDPSVRRGQCYFDNGGPLTVDGKFAGILSYYVNDPFCANSKLPGVYTRVSAYVNWILERAK